MKKILAIIISVALFAACKKDSQINPIPVAQPVEVTPPLPVKITYSIFPNPCTGTFTIETNSTATETVTITNVLGAVQLEIPINGTTRIVDNSLPNGVYYIKITNNSGSIIRRIIKM